jgi:hypothetical protein
MHLRKLPFSEQDNFSGQVLQWNIYAVAHLDGSCQVEDFLSEQLRGGDVCAAQELIALLEAMAFDAKGPRRWIGTSRCHESVAGKQIYEFKIGSLRVHWFYGQERCVAILARAVTKKSNTTPKELAKQLVTLKSNYEKAAKVDSIVIVDSAD